MSSAFALISNPSLKPKKIQCYRSNELKGVKSQEIAEIPSEKEEEESVCDRIEISFVSSDLGESPEFWFTRPSCFEMSRDGESRTALQCSSKLDLRISLMGT